MPSLLIVVFLVQLIIHLINTFGASFINDLLWILYNKLPVQTSQNVQEQTRLRREVVRLRREMNATSSQDQFAKWARLRRQHDKCVEEYEKKNEAVNSSKSSFDMTVTASRWVSTNGLRLFLQFWYAKTPIFAVPKAWVPQYVAWVLAFPRAPSGSVSIQIWGGACATVIALAGEAIGYAVRAGGVTEGKGRRKEEGMKFAGGGGKEKVAGGEGKKEL